MPKRRAVAGSTPAQVGTNEQDTWCLLSQDRQTSPSVDSFPSLVLRGSRTKDSKHTITLGDPPSRPNARRKARFRLRSTLVAEADKLPSSGPSAKGKTMPFAEEALASPYSSSGRCGCEEAYPPGAYCINSVSLSVRYGTRRFQSRVAPSWPVITYS